MNPGIEKELEELAEVVVEVGDEVEWASEEEDATLEDIERAKALAADFLTRYDNFLKKLGSDDRMEVQRLIGLKVDQLKGRLAKLKEAPE